MKILNGSIYNGGLWFQMFGYGISVVNKKKHPPLFSEREGFRKVFRIGKLGIEFLKPQTLKSTNKLIERMLLAGFNSY